MIFHKERKLAFFLPFKTGTTTIVRFLEPLGWKSLYDRHAEPNKCFDRFPNLNNYTIYGFLRNPLLRFESAILHLKRLPTPIHFTNGLNEIGKTIESATYEDVVDAMSYYIKYKIGLFTILQSQWLDHPKVTVLDFDNFESELRKVTGYTTQPIMRENAAGDFPKGVITDKVRAFVREYYAADYALAKDRLGKEYNP